MPHPNQQAQQATSPAVADFQRDGARGSNGHRSTNGLALTDGQDQSAPGWGIETAVHIQAAARRAARFRPVPTGIVGLDWWPITTSVLTFVAGVDAPGPGLACKSRISELAW